MGLPRQEALFATCTKHRQTHPNTAECYDCVSLHNLVELFQMPYIIE